MPYQLHCALVVVQACDELDDTTLLDELLEGTRLDEDERLEGMEEEEVDLLVVTDELVTLTVQVAPDTMGISIEPSLLTCTPNETVWPGWIFAFQLKLEAV